MTLKETLTPQAREILESFENRFPATTKVIFDHIDNPKYSLWTELPYYVVKMIHERVFNGDPLEPIEEDEIRLLFTQFYE